MITEAAIFTCSICGESSREICTFCTKDACENHLCERCKRCSDCCVCEVRLVQRERGSEIATTVWQHQPEAHPSLSFDGTSLPSEQPLTTEAEFPEDEFPDMSGDPPESFEVN